MKPHDDMTVAKALVFIRDHGRQNMLTMRGLNALCDIAFLSALVARGLVDAFDPADKSWGPSIPVGGWTDGVYIRVSGPGVHFIADHAETADGET